MNIGEQIKNHPLYAICTILVVPLIVGTWGLSEAIRVTPLNQEKERLEKRVAELSQKNTELNNLVASQGSAKQSQESIADWQNRNAELQKRIEVYKSNCDILSEIRALDKRKLEIDKRERWTSVGRLPGSSVEDAIKEDFNRTPEKERRQSSELQARILSLQERLMCQPR
jgi:hypothetical protein